jgi:FixJ family two-component response regulator
MEIDKLDMGIPLLAKVTGTIRIGIVDDDASFGKALARLLRGHGYDCVVYESGEVALADPELHRMHCLVVDIQLTGMDGFEFCGRIDAVGVRIPHIFITAYIDPDSVDTSDRLGDRILLIKPVDEHELLASIERAMADHHN